MLDRDALAAKPYSASALRHLGGGAVNVAQVHRDAVLELPPCADRLAASEHCLNEIFAVGRHVLAVQGHPEFEPGVCDPTRASQKANKHGEREREREREDERQIEGRGAYTSPPGAG